jgi:hypothetical protein
MTSNQSRKGWCMPLNKASLSTSLPENQDKYDDENNDAK